MTSTFSIGCRQCQKHLWIGQRGAGSVAPYVYTLPRHIAALNEFLAAHQGHPLVFDDNCNSVIADWEEIDVKEPDITADAQREVVYTSDKPTAPGFFWYRDLRGHEEIYEIGMRAGELVVFLGEGEHIYQQFMDGEFAGPIPRPRR